MIRTLEHHLTKTLADRTAYRDRLTVLIGNLDRLESEADRQIIALFSEVRRDIVSTLAELPVDSLSRPLYEKALAGVDESIGRLAERWGLIASRLEQDGFNLGAELAWSPGSLAGVEGLEVLAAGLSTDRLRIFSQMTSELVGGVTAELSARIRRELAGVAAGAQTPFDAAKKIGRNLTDRNHFSTMLSRARAITVTELGRAQAVGTQAAQEQLATAFPDIRKRWLNAHLPGARQTHLEAEARYSTGGAVGPIPVDETFEVAGLPALYPRDPSLPASESVNCHCVVISVFPDAESGAPGKGVGSEPQTALEDERQSAQTGDSGGVAAGGEQRDRPEWEVDNEKRMQRLRDRPTLTPPADWSKWSNAKRLRWLETEMEADWPRSGPGGVLKTTRRSKFNTRAKLGKFYREHGRLPNDAERWEFFEWDPSRTSFDLKGANADGMLPFMSELRSLAASYPDVAMRLEYVGTYKGTKGVPFRNRARMFDGEVAHASNDGFRIGINTAKTGSLDDLTNQASYSNSTGWWTTGHPMHTIVHEWGHQIENLLKRRPDLRSRYEAIAAARAFGAPSDYGRRSPAEAFAEAFAAAWLEGREIRPGLNVRRPSKGLALVEIMSEQIVAQGIEAAP